MTIHRLLGLLLGSFLSTSALGATECLTSRQFTDDFVMQSQIVDNSLVNEARAGVLGNVIQPE
jgi:hypothetical protein